jgi:pyruvate ferredoxin oxidoreductase beta subunit
VVVIGGDGGTYDIGMGGLSGMFERGQDILYICYDNEAYMNTGVQRSAATPFLASTTTSPHGKESWGEDRPKKDMPAIAVAHGVPYVATASLAYPQDLVNKVKALSIKAPNAFRSIACNIGFTKEQDDQALAFQAGWCPLEVENGGSPR